VKEEMKKHIITEEEYQAVKEVGKRNKLKRVEKRLQVILLRYEGKKDREIGEKLGYSRRRVSRLCAEFKEVGVEEYARHKYGGNHRALTEEEEREILDGFETKAVKGEVVTVQSIKAAFDKKRGKDTGRGYIYMLLARHGWRKVMPRGQHPKKASEAEIEASKKLTLS
jgi:transposase